MGLDTSHDCWHGPYSFFMEWRIQLHGLITGEEATEWNLQGAWSRGVYADQSVPINVLMNHSDCDGQIASEVCGPLADALEALAAKMPPSVAMFDLRDNTERFVRGLRRAAAAGEPVVFH